MKSRLFLPALIIFSLSCLATIQAASLKSPKRTTSQDVILALPPMPASETLAGQAPPAQKASLSETISPALDALSNGPLASSIDAIINKKSFASTQWSILISDLQRGETLYSYNSNGILLPASNRKLFTSALALDQLGPDYRFTTNLYLVGQRDTGGHFTGDLLVVPCGDPTFSARWSASRRPDERFREWADELLAQDIKQIQGNVIIDISGFDPTELYAPGWSENQLTTSYSAPVGAFSFNENVISVVASPGKTAGAPCRIRLEPTAGDFQIINNTRTGTKYALSVTRRPGQNVIEVKGSLPRGGKTQRVSLSVANPNTYGGNALVAALKNKGIRITGELKLRTNKVSLPPNAVKAISSQSVPLSEILKEVNQNSNNFMAEHVYRAVAYEKTGQGSYANVHQIEEQFLSRIGVDITGMQLVDGCGLSRLNQTNATAFVQLLQAMDRHPHSEVFKETLSVGGQTGTLRRRFAEPALRGKLIGKTGFLKGVSCLSGYLSCPNGSRVAVSILTNFPGGAWPQMQAQEAICKAVINGPGMH